MSTTPGPWAVGKPFMWHRRECIPIIHDGKVKPTVAIVMDAAQDMGIEQYHRDDARLIATAPRLRKALHDLVRGIEHPTSGIFERAMHEARAALEASRETT